MTLYLRLVRDVALDLLGIAERLRQHWSVHAASLGLSGAQVKVLLSLVPGEAVPMRSLADRLDCDAFTSRPWSTVSSDMERSNGAQIRLIVVSKHWYSLLQGSSSARRSVMTTTRHAGPGIVEGQTGIDEGDPDGNQVDPGSGDEQDGRWPTLILGELVVEQAPPGGGMEPCRTGGFPGYRQRRAASS